MRGSFFAKPLEIVLEIEGERWRQGESVRGRLTLRHRGSAAHPLAGLDVQLCRAQLSAVKKKADGAFKPIVSHEISGELAPGAALEREFEFALGMNAPITDSVSSVFVTCGPGALQLQVEPSLVIQEFTSTLQAQHHFGFKAYKHSKTGVEAKFSAPDGQRFAAIEGLVLTSRFAEDSGQPDLLLHYEFEIRQVGAGPLPMKVAKGSRTVEQVMRASEYLTPSGRVSFDEVRKRVAEAVSSVESKILF